MGSGCSSESHPADSLIIDDTHGLEFDVPARQKKWITLIISKKDQTRLLNASKGFSRTSFIELGVTVKSPPPFTPEKISLIIENFKKEKGELSRTFIPTDKYVTLSILRIHTRDFQPGRLLMCVQGGVQPARVHLAARVSVNLQSSEQPDGWGDELMRLRNEVAELQATVAKQKEFILILKRKFMEKGELLSQKEKDLVIEKQKRARFIINAWRQRTIVPAFQEWAKYAKDRKARKKELLGKIVLRMGNASLWQAYRHWRNYCEQFKVNGLKRMLMQEKAKRAQQIIKAWRERTLTPVFQAWKAYIARKKQLMHKIVMRLQNGPLWRAFRHWSTMCAEGKVDALKKKMDEMMSRERARRIKMFLEKWRSRTVVPVFQAWRKYAHENIGKKKRLLGKMVLRMSQSKIWGAFRQWRHLIENEKVSKLQAQLNKHRAKRAEALITAWRMRSLTPVFLAWRNHTAGTRGRKKQLLGKVVLRLQNSVLWRGFRHWRQVIEQDKVAEKQNQFNSKLKDAKKKRLQSFLSKWTRSSLVSSFRAWASYSRQRRQRKKELLGKVVKKMANANLWKAFRQWRQYSDSCKADDMRQQMRLEIMNSLGKNNNNNLNGWGGDYGTLLSKYRDMKLKKQRMEISYDQLYRFLQRFRVAIAKNIAEEIERLTHHCRCDVCVTKRKMLNQNGINEWLFQFDREIVKFKFPG